MKCLKTVVLLGLFATFTACAGNKTSIPRDVHSFAQPEEAAVTHVSLDLTPDFKSHRLTATARLTIKRGPGADRIVLDARDLTIKSVTDSSGAMLAFNAGPEKAFLGSTLTVMIGNRSGMDTT